MADTKEPSLCDMVLVNGVMRSELVTEVSHRGQAILLFGQFDGEAAALVIVSIED